MFQLNNKFDDYKCNPNEKLHDKARTTQMEYKKISKIVRNKTKTICFVIGAMFYFEI